MLIPVDFEFLIDNGCKNISHFLLFRFKDIG
jgi:hypothetical protein